MDRDSWDDDLFFTLPIIMEVKMGPSNSSYLSNIASFHFHDCGRKSKDLLNKNNGIL